jgi:NADH-quinone oxidoreductase subunit A
VERTYLPVLLLLGFVIANAVLMLGVSHLTMRSRPTPEKQTPYESGMPPLGDARERFSVKFYMVAMLFIVFDIETVFMIPWGAHFRELSCAVPLRSGACPAGQISLFGLGEMVVFIVILLVGFVYVWKKGALQWD